MKYEIVCEIQQPGNEAEPENRVMATTVDEEAAKAIVYCLQQMEEDPNTNYYYSDVEE